MLVILNLLILLFPVVPLALLLTSVSDGRRRTWLLQVALSIFIVFMWSSLVGWMVRDAKMLGVNLTLFDEPGGAALARYFDGVWPATVYILLIAVAGYLANERSLRRINKGLHKADWHGND